MSLSRRIFSAVALSATLALAACGGGGDTGSGSTAQGSFEREGDRGLGDPNAPVTMIEYASVACGHCATFHNEVWSMLEDDYIETGKVRFVMREMITGNAQFAIAGFALAHCVPEDRYYDMVDLLFQQQNVIFRAAQTQGNARNQYLAIARSLGLSEADFTRCLNDQDINQAIVEAHERALDEGIDSTPRFLFNGQLLESRRAPGATEYTYYLGGEQLIIDGEPVPGIVDADTFRLILDHLVAEAGGVEASDEATTETAE